MTEPLTKLGLTNLVCIFNENGCIECFRSPDSDGYPRRSVNGKLMRLHRIVYEHYHGKIPEGHVIRHTCDNPKCINPLHLTIGTQADNMSDMKERGRIKGCALPGEKNHNSKLTKSRVRDIRSRKHPAQHYADKYDVSRKTIYAIWEGERWTSVK